MATELTETSTHEDIEKYVDEIVADRAGESKGDAQVIAEERDKPVGDMSADADSGTEEDAADKGDESGESREWLDDDLKAEVTAYGLSEDDLAEFTSREEVERALRIFDRRALEAGRKSISGEESSERDEKGRFAKKEPESEVETKEGAYDIKLDKDVYDEEIIGEFTRLRDHYESRVAALESRFMEADALAKEERFDRAVDSLGHPELFGITGKESPEELKRREELFVASEAMQFGMERFGRPSKDYNSLVNRVSRMVCAEELFKKELKARTKSAIKQSNSRQGGGATRAPDPVESAREEARRYYKELEGAG